MKNHERYHGRRDHLKRLPREHYQGQAYVHWSMATENRKTGWLVPIVYYKFREILTHTAFRYGICCPIYCCMPDHLHLLWVGIDSRSDQILASRFFRKQMNEVLAKVGYQFQREAYDHVLAEQEHEGCAFQEVVEYIARNPERAGLVPQGGFRDYRHTDCLVPGYPELHLWQADYWERFWRTYAHLANNRGIFSVDESSNGESYPRSPERGRSSRPAKNCQVNSRRIVSAFARTRAVESTREELSSQLAENRSRVRQNAGGPAPNFRKRSAD